MCTPHLPVLSLQMDLHSARAAQKQDGHGGKPPAPSASGGVRGVLAPLPANGSQAPFRPSQHTTAVPHASTSLAGAEPQRLSLDLLSTSDGEPGDAEAVRMDADCQSGDDWEEEDIPALPRMFTGLQAGSSGQGAPTARPPGFAQVSRLERCACRVCATARRSPCRIATRVARSAVRWPLHFDCIACYRPAFLSMRHHVPPCRTPLLWGVAARPWRAPAPRASAQSSTRS